MLSLTVILAVLLLLSLLTWCWSTDGSEQIQVDVTMDNTEWLNKLRFSKAWITDSQVPYTATTATVVLDVQII